jgi:hypothetical protein
MTSKLSPPEEEARDVPPTDAARPPAALRMALDARSIALTVLAVIAVVFALHWAQAVFIPLMLGVMISYALSAPVNLMQRWHVPRALGAGLLLLAIIGGAGSAVYSLGAEASEMIETPRWPSYAGRCSAGRERPKARWRKCNAPPANSSRWRAAPTHRRPPLRAA